MVQPELGDGVQAEATVRGLNLQSDVRHLSRGDYRNINHHDWPLPDLWLGVSCESQQYADERIPLLL